MRRFATLATAAVAALALAVPTATTAEAAGAGAGSALPGAAQAGQAPATAAAFKPKKGKKGNKNKGSRSRGNKLKIKKSDKGVQPGVAALKLTVNVKGKGKVKFTVKGDAGTAKGKAKIKKGKAKFTVPALNAGDYKVKAKFGGRKGKTKFRVFASALTFTTPTSFTISKDTRKTAPNALPKLAGNVGFKDTVPNQGYVDVYPLGSPLGAANTVRFVGVGAQGNPAQAAGVFDFQTTPSITNSFLYELQTDAAYPVGTYQFQAYYTFDADFVDYLTSSVITVTLTD